MDSLGVETQKDFMLDKDRAMRHNLRWLLNKTAEMFEYENLPDSLPRIALERLLQLCGSVAIWRVPEHYKPVGYGADFTDTVSVQDNIYAFNYTLAENPDPYDEPYKVVITSPGFRPTISETLEINKDVVVIRNDTYYQGLYQLHKKYAYLLTEAEISLRSTLITLRDQITFVAKNERQRAEANSYMQAREAGTFAAILAPELGSEFGAIQHDGRSNAVELAVNGIQAIKSAWFNEIGLNPSFSLKREYTSAQEIDSNTDLLQPIVDDMFYCRQKGVEQMNRLFGTNVSVKKSSAWEIKEREIDLAIEAEEAEIEAMENADTVLAEEGGETDDSTENGDEATS